MNDGSLASNDAARAGAWRRLALVAALPLAALLGLVLFSRTLPSARRAPFDTSAVRRVAELRPDYVVLGNSMVETRFDGRELARLLAPQRVLVMGVGGSKSAYWYLALKNVIFPASRPRRVLIFFRVHELTHPRERALGAERRRLDRVSLAEEPLLEQKLAPTLREPIERLGWYLGRLAPVDRLRAATEPALESAAARLGSLLAFGGSRGSTSAAVNRVFALGRLRSAVDADEPEPARDVPFDTEVEESFLPDILALAREAHVPLTFVRVRRRHDAERRRPRPNAYQAELASYLEKHGAEVVDMTSERWEKLSFYGQGDHIAVRYRQRYTRLFVEHLGHVFH